MSSYDKLVKLACKPKPAPPKQKYLEPIVAATWSTDGAVHDVCKALSPRFREPNAIVVFKALIVLHYMIRNGSTDNVLSYLSSSDVIRLRHVSEGNWEGYSTPQHLQNYAIYLSARIRAYRDLKHDAIRVQSESNRDLRNQNSIEEDNLSGGQQRPREDVSASFASSKTIMGRKLRLMTVEKGLLRETKVVQQMIRALLECRLYLGDLEDELTIAALRMLVQDLLILFQACNEGVINVLEHYFEMSRIDAKDALKIYRQFCAQTEGVVEYLGVAKKLQNLLNVPIPNLKHAPISLAGALEECLNDPNFEQNRTEHKERKAAKSSSSSKPSQEKTEASPPSVPAVPNSPTSQKPTKPAHQHVVDLLSSIEEEQPTNSNQANSPVNITQFSATPNPFIQMGLATGQPFMSRPVVVSPAPLQIQPTGFLVPQQTAFPPQLQTNPFSSSLQVPSPAGMFQPFVANGSLLQMQATGGDFLRPQITGANPFRQSMLVPQTTGAALFTPQANQSNFQPNSSGPTSGASTSSFLSSTSSASATSSVLSTSTIASAALQPPSASAFSPPARPASTPLVPFSTSSQQQQSSTSPPFAQPVRTHTTGSRNPFGPPASELPPPVPKPPTLMELAMAGAAPATAVNGSNSPPTQSPTGVGGSNMAGVASSFAFAKSKETTTSGSLGTGAFIAQNTSTTLSGSTFFDSLASSQFTGATTLSNTSSSPSLSTTLKPQTTGFAGLKPFKPTSSFGAALLESLPPIPNTSPTSPTGPSAYPPPSATGSLSSVSRFGVSALNEKPAVFSGSSLGVGLRPQITGGGPANPFRASMAPLTTTSASTFSTSTIGGLTAPQSSVSFGSGIRSGTSTTSASTLGTGSLLSVPGSGLAFGSVSEFGSMRSQSAVPSEQQNRVSLI